MYAHTLSQPTISRYSRDIPHVQRPTPPTPGEEEEEFLIQERPREAHAHPVGCPRREEEGRRRRGLRLIKEDEEVGRV